MTPEELLAAQSRVRSGHCLILGPNGRLLPESVSQPTPQTLYGWSTWEQVGRHAQNSWGPSWGKAALDGEFSAQQVVTEVKDKDGAMSAWLHGFNTSWEKAADAINDFTRKKLKEDGFFHKILPPLAISNEELDQGACDTEPAQAVSSGGDAQAPAPHDLLDKGFETLLNNAGIPEELFKESLKLQAAPAALKKLEDDFSIPFGVLPTSPYIEGPKYKVIFDEAVGAATKTWVLESYLICQDVDGKRILCQPISPPAAASSSPVSSCLPSSLQDLLLSPRFRRVARNQRNT